MILCRLFPGLRPLRSVNGTQIRVNASGTTSVDAHEVYRNYRRKFVDNEANDQLKASLDAANAWYSVVLATCPTQDLAVFSRFVGMHCFTAGATWQRERDMLKKTTDGTA